MKFFGKIENKKLVLDNNTGFNDYTASLKQGDLMILDIKKRRKFRSLNQNALYWKWLEIIGNDLGYDIEELHPTFKAMFLMDRSLKVPLIRSTSKLSTIEFGQYLNKIEKFCNQELNITLPSPEDYQN